MQCATDSEALTTAWKLSVTLHAAFMRLGPMTTETLRLSEL